MSFSAAFFDTMVSLRIPQGVFGGGTDVQGEGMETQESGYILLADVFGYAECVTRTEIDHDAHR